MKQVNRTNRRRRAVANSLSLSNEDRRKIQSGHDRVMRRSRTPIMFMPQNESERRRHEKEIRKKNKRQQ